MTQYTCISIGINHYHSLQSLNYAQADAEGLIQCLQDHCHLDKSQSLLMTDVSPRLGTVETYPSRGNILAWLEADPSVNPALKVNANSVLWFFFSGYGLHYQGEDYLIPIDGDPSDLVNTGISISSLLTLLQQQGAGKIVVILDFNRSAGMLGEKGVGEQTAILAGKMGIACILSAHPHQFSHEAASLGHGMFTSVLLDALKYYRRDLTLDNLNYYLNQRLPELTEHHWRPVQNPMMVIPMVEMAQLPILPALVAEDVNLAQLKPVSMASSVNQELNGLGLEQFTPLKMGTNGSNGTVKTVKPETTSSSASSNGSVNGNGFQVALPPLPLNGNGHPPLITSFPNGETPQQVPVIPQGKRRSTVFNFSNFAWQDFFNQELLTKGLIGLVLVVLTLFGFNKFFRYLSSSPSNNAVTTTKTTNNNKPEITPPTNLPQKTIGQEFLQKAQAQFSNAQASNFVQAIDQARQVPVEDPYYAQAQEFIQRWSYNIWDIAQSRADQGNFASAIAAAQLIPKDQNPLFTQSQAQIAQWQEQSTQQTQNNLILQQAKSLLNYKQASSYIKAIRLLEGIKPNTVGYEEAQKLKEEWSRQVYLIANSRAARGKFQLAIQTAVLVPKDTAVYPDAQKAIARWQQGKK